MPTDKRIVCFRAVIYLVLLLMCASPSFAATTITDWATAQSGYPGSTAGAVNDAAGGIVWSRHNLSSYGFPFQPTVVTGSFPIFTFNVLTTEICVFCHTPHFGNQGVGPLWNRGSSATGYVAYGTSAGTGQDAGKTLAGTTTGVGGSSLACLSCHDGVTTFDNLINKPGKGSRTDGTGADQGWWFLMVGTGDEVLDHFSATTAGGTSCGTCHPQDEQSRLNIGGGPNFSYSAKTVDLSNDHPINVPYNGGTVASLRDSATVISSLTMDNARSTANDSTMDIYGRSDNLWAVKGFISSSATIADVLRDNGKVQCSSCHDPHYKNQTNTDPAVVAASGGFITSVENDGLFLRRVGGNSNSGVCRTCHGK